MTAEQALGVLVMVTLIEMMAAIGLGVKPDELAAVGRDWWLMARAAFANYALVPAATVGLLLLFQAPPMAAAGFLILAACPGAPFGPPLTAIAKGDVAVSVGLMAALAASSAVIAPVLLAFLMPLLSGDEPLRIDAAKIAFTLLVTQLLPLAVGLGVRLRWPALAERMLGPATLLSKVLNLAVVVGVLAANYHLLAEIRLRGWSGMVVLLMASWAAGWVMAGASSRKALTLTTGLRNVGVGLVIATASFPGTAAVTAVLAFGLLGVFGSLLLALAWGRGAPPSTREGES